MTDGAIILVVGCVGALIGFYVGRHYLLYQIHQDDLENARATHRKRKQRYLKRKTK